MTGPDDDRTCPAPGGPAPLGHPPQGHSPHNRPSRTRRVAGTSRLRRLAGALGIAAALAIGSTTAPSPAAADEDDLAAAVEALAAWDLDEAHDVLDAADPGGATDVARGMLAVYEGRYAEAESLLAGALAAGGLTTEATEDAKHYLALARGSTKALEGGITVRSDDGFVEAVFASEKDALIAPYLFDAMAQARIALGDDLGVRPADPVRFEFLDDPLKLAMVTPLSVDNIRTTGTVGVTKYRRIMMISPRVMLYGYGWIDTAVHEYVHYLVTLRTDNRAPVWLQEGLAKLLETRWRRTDPEPLDDPVAFRLHRAIVSDDLVTFDEMYPSVAMLPSQERAALAYAEVQTMLQLVRERRGAPGIETLLDRVAAGDDAKEALAEAWGDDFDDFMEEWKKVTRRRTAKGAEGPLSHPTFKEDPDAPPPEELGDVFSQLGGGRARQHARLGTLLQARDHDAAAVLQYEKARKADARARADAQLSRRLGKLYVELGRYAEAVPLLDLAAAQAPDDANLAAAQGRAHLHAGDPDGADQALRRAIRVNPFIPAIHCDLAELTDDPLVADREKKHCR